MKQRSPRLLIFLTVFIDLLGFGIVIPIYSYIAKEYVHGAYWSLLIGLLSSSYSIFQMLFAPFLGRLSDRMGRRPILLLSLAGSTTSYLMFAVARNYPMLLLARIVGGICGANISVAQAYIADVTEPEKRTAGMGLIGMAFGLGFTFGPVIGGFAALFRSKFFPGLAEQTCPGLAAASICLLNFLWAIRSLPESLPKESRGRAETQAPSRYAPMTRVVSSLSHRVIGPLVGVFFLATLAFSNLEVAFGLYIKGTPELGLSERGLYGMFIYIGLLLAFMQGYVVRKLVKVVSEPMLVIVGIAAQAVGLGLLPIIPQIWCMFVALGFVSFGQGVCTPSLLALVSKATTADRQGETLGITQSASSLARILGPMVAGGMITLGTQTFSEVIGLRWPFWSGGAIMVLAVGMAILTRLRLQEAGKQEGFTAETQRS